MDKPRYFDRARRDDWAYKPYTKEEHEKLDRFMDASGISTGQRILEPGCGTGRFTQKLAARVGELGEVVALDPSEGMIEECRIRAGGLPNVKILQMPVEETAFPPGTFDTIFCLCVFPHFDDKPKVLGIFRHVLAPSGRLTVAHLEGSRILNKMHREVGGPVKEDRIPPYSIVETTFHEAGFRIDHFQDEDDGYLLIALPKD
jgi:demethylmenaquinone methyltransferase/2-methoxy-6-polyprenyl-1,4-benzoquinol methylase